MRQKITLQIENDTGVEFEEQAEFREPKEGDWILQEQTFNMLIHKTSNDCKYPRIILTPKVDTELESAKKKFPENSYFTHSNYGSNLLKVFSVFRHDKHGVTIVTEGNLPNLDVNNCTPFPLPVWRCCEADKHLLQPRKAYFVRSKKKDVWLLDTYDPVRGWEEVNHENKYEWLDEGER